MRLPYLQVTQETWSRARELAGVLEIPRHLAMGIILDLWAWALELGPEDAPPTGELHSPNALKRMAAAIEFPPSKAVELADALQDVGLIEWDADGVTERVRVRGLSRYQSTWEKRKADRERAALGRESLRHSGDVAATSQRPPEKSLGKTQTQTQTEKQKEETDDVRAPREKSPVPVVPEKPDKPDDAWDGMDFWAWAQAKRREAELQPERRPNERAVSAWWSQALMQGATPKSLRRAFIAFGNDPYWTDKKRAPPVPFNGFLSQWERFVIPEASHAAG
jgi:hypothetical protein